MLDFCQNSSGCSNVAILHLEYLHISSCRKLKWSFHNTTYALFDTIVRTLYLRGLILNAGDFLFCMSENQGVIKESSALDFYC